MLQATVFQRKDMKLSIKQENFCNYYIESGNASDAYRRSYCCAKMKDATVNRKAVELLNNGKVTARVSELQGELKKKSDITKERILAELECIAFADIRDFLKIESGEVAFVDSSLWTDRMARAVDGVKQTKDGLELKLHGKNWSIARICKMLGYDEPAEMNIKHILANIDTGTDD